MATLFLLLLFLPCSLASQAYFHTRPQVLAQQKLSSSWNTLHGSVPLVIARGGSSGLFPDQTQIAYAYAINNSLPGTAMFCDLQLTKDSIGICRSGIDLGNSTSINETLPNYLNTYDVNGIATTGFFSIDLTGAQALNLTATQAVLSRTYVYDNMFHILQPENVSVFATQYQSTFWLNVEYVTFYQQHKLDMASYVLSSLKALSIAYISSPEVTFLKAIKAGAPKTTTKLLFRFHNKEDVEPSTNVTYGSLLNNLKQIATFAAGIIVPKDFIWPENAATSYIGPETTLVQDAHNAGLAVYASDFVNDPALPIYNYSFDPIREYLQYMPSTGANVDGFLTDFPSTASEALACYRSSSLKQTASKTKPLVISHCGARGDYPGCTLLAYQGAVEGGASYIDCPIQMTKDGIPICRDFPDLLLTTDISEHTNFFPSRVTLYPELQPTKGIFTFNMTWDEIITLKARMYSPEQNNGVRRNQAYTQENIMSLSDFLSFANNVSAVGLLIDIQYGYFLDTQIQLDVVSAVISAINAAGLQKSDRVIIQSEDSAVLRRLQSLTSFGLVYKVTSASTVIGATQVQEIKGLATTVTLMRGLLAPTDSQSFFLLNASTVVDLFHAQNMSVFVSYFRNEFVALANDYESDPALELNTFIQLFKVEGLITDFPATARAYLNNKCLDVKTEAAGFAYPMHFVMPGELLSTTLPNYPPLPPSPSPLLNISEGNYSAISAPTVPPISSPTPPPPAATPPPPSAPAPTQSAASRPLHLVASMVSALYIALLLLVLL